MKACLVTLLLVVSPVAARAADPFADTRLTTLPNGLHVLLAPDSTALSVGLGVWVRAGSRYESRSALGVSDLVEHLMFLGTSKTPPGEYGRRVQGEGGTFGGLTTADHTRFESVVPPAALETVLRLEADRFREAVITPAQFELARRAVRGERRGRADQTAVGRALRLLYATAYAGHPYGVPVAGLDEDTDRLTLSQVQAYRTAQYVPGRMLVTLAGRFDPTRALAAVQRTLGTLPARPGAAERVPPPAPSGARRAHGVAPAPAASAVFAVGWRTPPASDPDAAALEVLARILTTGSTARIQTALVHLDAAPCASTQGGYDARALGGLLYVVAAPNRGVDSTRVESAVAAMVDSLVRTPVGAEELERARRQFELELLRAWQTPAGVGRALGASWLSTGEPRALPHRLERARTLSVADVQRVAARVLAAANRAEVWITPETARQGDQP